LRERSAACCVEIGCDKTSSGFEIGNNGNFGADAVEIVNRERELCFVGDGQQMQNGIFEPPVAATPAMAFSMAALVMILEGVNVAAKKFHHHFACTHTRVCFAAFVQGRWKSPIGAIPRNSQTKAMVFAVNCPPQAPAPGQAATSSDLSCASDIRRASCLPIAS